MATPTTLEEIPQIIIHRPQLRNLVICPKCNNFIFTNIELVLKEKKFICFKCKKKSDISKLKVIKDVRSYLSLIFKKFSEHKKGVLTISGEIEYEKDMNNLIKIINEAKLAWKIDELKEDFIKVKLCTNCGYCRTCGKIVTLKKDYKTVKCSQCGGEHIKYNQVKDNECPNCSNKELREDKRKILITTISIAHIRKMFYDSELKELKI